MRTASVALVVTLALGLLVSRGVLAQASRAAEAQFKAAQHTEEVEGDLKGAIEQYKKLAQGSDRAIAAKALLQMAACYEKLGQSDAQKTYERVVREFADQLESAATAQTRLAALGTRASTSPADLSYHLAWTAPGRNTYLSSVSPDGRYISYYINDEGGNLFLHDLATGLDRQLTRAVDKTKESAEGESAFSRDGKQLAYGWTNNRGFDELRVIDLGGSETPQPRRLGPDNAFGFIQPDDWTPDGKWIAVFVNKDNTDQIALISTSDGSLRLLKSVDQLRVGDGFLSPDGKYFAFDYGARGGPGTPAAARDIFVLATDGRQEIPAVVNPADERLAGWSPDGTRLIFTSRRTGSNSLFALTVRDGRPQGEPILIRPDVGRLDALGLTISGSLYTKGTSANGGGATSVVKTGSFDFSTGEILSPPSDLALQYFAASNKSPEWSPDGTSLAYVVERGRSAGEFGLAIRSLGTDQVEELRPQLGHVQWLRWAPDGRSFVVAATDIKGASGLWRVDRTTAAVSAITQGTGDFSPRTSDWPRLDDRFHGSSPDAQKIYYQRSLEARQTSGQGVALFERDLASGVERELFRRPALGPGVVGYQGFAMSLSADVTKLYYRKDLGVPSPSDPSVLQAAFIERDLASGAERELARGNLGFPYLSPDGRSIATNTADVATKSQSILIVPVAGGEPRVLMRVALPQSVIDQVMLTKDAHGQNAMSVLWAPDSRSLLFRHNFVQGKPDVWWVPVDGREPPKLVGPGVPERLWDIRVHPDGRRLAMAVQDPQQSRPAELWVLENFLPKAGAKR
jgi:Tol biopolymer transport system component